MNVPARRLRILQITGFVCMLAGVLDPLEGSIVILWGVGMVAAGAFVGIRLPFERIPTGHSMWWGRFMVPYPIGWVRGIIGAILRFRESRGLRAQPHGAVQ